MQIILNNWTWQTINTYLYWKFKKLNSTIRIYKVLYKICHLIQSIKRLFSIIIYYLFINVIVMYNTINSKLQSFIFSVHDFSVTRNIIYIHWKKLLKYQLRNKRFLRWHVYVYASHSDKGLYRLLEFNESCSYLE